MKSLFVDFRNGRSHDFFATVFERHMGMALLDFEEHFWDLIYPFVARIEERNLGRNPRALSDAFVAPGFRELPPGE